MEERRITRNELEQFQRHLSEEEYAPGSVEKYLRDVRRFGQWLRGEPVTKAAVLNWREHLRASGYKPTTINAMLTSVNGFLKFMGWDECRVKELRIQRRMFRNVEKELSRDEYFRLLQTARDEKKERLSLLMETICASGIRVSEVKYITVEAVQNGRADISLKGKIRTILLPGKLCRKLLKYARKQKITSGEIFLTRGGRGISRRQIWAEMKALCAKAGVAPSKVFPHNLRHLFARMYYRAYRDVARLADVLGHSSIETTRIYLISTGIEHAKQLDRLGLIC